jgi:hypothetical protein
LTTLRHGRCDRKCDDPGHQGDGPSRRSTLDYALHVPIQNFFASSLKDR